ncbi:iron-siderophore ABC transporter substrate-binding protein [Ensifer adhaerens]|nr:iron-siderophore ABC transporter substrate-binding protein [Ensifer adhaerens]UAY05017.1 iron-siderophore ABC transporter substrate-binding protein [Ensifer adhaerens]UAY12437.1 iron-siderophore ABC transporter substrate-binding protein [Ensifer adhaerens]
MLVFCGTAMVAPKDIGRAEDSTHVVRHALGQTRIVSHPQRIMTLGWSGEDVVLALGQTPVAMTRYGAFASGMFPWVEEKFAGPAPTLLSGDFDYEKIAALKPDLILGVYSGIDERAYKRLSAIAPTVVYRSGPWSADWHEQTTIIGETLGKAREAEALIEGTEKQLGALGQTHPELEGKSFTFGTYFPGSNGIVVYLPKDPRVAALTGLGLLPSEGVRDLSKRAPEETSVSVSLEELSSIDADVFIMWYGPGARAAAEAQPLFNMLGAVKRGSYVALEDPVDVWSTSALSVLSIPYGFPRFVPRLAEAAAHANGR